MPYIRNEMRSIASRCPVTPSELNYALTIRGLSYLEGFSDLHTFSASLMKMIDAYRQSNPVSYATFNAIMGVLISFPMEMERRLSDDYVDELKRLKEEVDAYIQIFYAIVMTPYEEDRIAAHGDVFPVQMVTE